MLAFFVAVASEQSCLERHLQALRSQLVDGFPVVIGRQALVCRSGIGGKRAGAAAEAVLSRSSPGAVVSLGFAGGITDSVRSGELVLSERVYRYENGAAAPFAFVESDRHLLEVARNAAAKAGVSYCGRNSLTVPAVVTTPGEKRRLAATCPAAIVEMESYEIGAAAAARGIPFVCVRAVTDGVSDRLPEFVLESEGLAQRPWRVIPLLLRHPQHAALLARLALKWRRAVAGLTRFSGEFLDLVPVAAA